MTPIGRILNRLNQDMNIIESELSRNFLGAVWSLSRIVRITLIISLALPMFFVYAIVMVLVYLLILVIRK